jgi:plastocyanin
MKSKILIAMALVGFMAAGCSDSTTPSTSDNTQNSQDNSGMGMNTTANGTVKSNPTTMIPPANTHFSTGSEADVPPTGAVKEIKISSAGFSPSTVTIKKGDYVKFTNTDSSSHWPASDPHPVHTGYPGFDALNGLAQNEVYTFQFQKTGTFGFHDHLRPSNHGTVIVK